MAPLREAAAQSGISAMSVARESYAATEGMVVSQYEKDGRPVDIRMRGGRFFMDDVSNIEMLPIAMTEYGMLHLGSVMDIEKKIAPETFVRVDRQDVMYIDVHARAGKKAMVDNAVNEITKRSEIYSRSDQSVFARYKTSLILTVILVFVLLYMTMGIQFESFLLPIVFMLTIPFALSGTGPALLLSSSSLDSGAILGLIVLFGLVVNNGIVLYEISLQNVAAGKETTPAIIEGSCDRVSSVLATTITTLFVLVPMAVTSKSATQASMSWSMAGGTIASLCLSLFVLPLVFIPFLKTKRGACENI
jgi:multidrug efflux pump subunit AcrB